ncbi:HPr family phosphocarrier protein [Entomospira culicis]|uniref:Phosphocarrier protein HPr n=1 Tax=Entomospira culicis TaxID=2719989 RepID=A0A968GJ27_9SPIO|nr:HPr family phosphocarrier protein [Entomospira culicis]NIZ18554.1 HPr family phosphocarrier protein [Entomospira culicis]NIZ68770.1 HPr family phosphocarrier protein [Entomospira culicis]WDI37366.1 HPr family phosphocarrier protein [Entomospira culicis]WDI38995.1 HPr family phosphocarrier protein [Entomospira culicis]
MISKTITITSPIGLHSRLAAGFVEQAKRFHSEIKMQRGEIFCNAKEFLKVLKLSVTQDSQVTLWVEGDDEEDALAQLSHYLETLTDQEIPMLDDDEAALLLQNAKKS